VGSSFLKETTECLNRVLLLFNKKLWYGMMELLLRLYSPPFHNLFFILVVY